MPTKAQEKTIQEYEAEALRARSALLRAEAEAEELTEQLEDLKSQRAAVSVKKLGSRTEAVKKYEQLDRQETKLRRDVALTRASISELEEALKEAEDELEAEEGRIAEETERLERERLQRDLLAAEVALQDAKRKLEALPGRPGDRLGRRVATILGKWLPPSVRPVVPEPPLATRGDDAS